MTSTVQPGPVRVLAVCTANICRSPAIELLLRSGLAGEGVTLDAVAVSSAGVDARDGATRCARSRSLLAAYGVDDVELWTSGARRLTAEDVRSADLILTASRTHRAAVARLLPAAQTRTFTLRQAARSAGEIAAGPLPAVVLLPPADDVRARLRWFVAELDAARGPADDPRDDDVPDPHVVGDTEHARAMTLMTTAVADLAACFRLVLAEP